jgi:hypothetical protein
MPNRYPRFESEDELRDWFESANLSDYTLDAALDVVVASHVALSVGEEPASTGTTTTGQTGTLTGPVHIVPA